jgi:hypothetical protein
MLENWDERDDVVAAGSICPVSRLRRIGRFLQATKTYGARLCQIVV